MKIIWRVFVTIVMLIFIGFGVVFYAFYIEPYRITVETVDVNENKSDPRMVKIVQLSDIHIKEDFQSHNLKKIIHLVNKQDPDIVVFTGDLYDNYSQYHEDAALVKALNNINARYAKIAIWGNRDQGGGASRHYKDIMEEAGFTVLKNESKIVRVGDKTILFTGLDDGLLGIPEMPDTSALPSSNYHILLLHEPDLITQYQDADYDLALSGHSHGGQIYIPFFSLLNEQATEITDLATKYSRGMYQLPTGKIKQLYVNTGIGTTHISARLGVPPKIAVLRVYLN